MDIFPEKYDQNSSFLRQFFLVHILIFHNAVNKINFHHTVHHEKLRELKQMIINLTKL